MSHTTALQSIDGQANSYNSRSFAQARKRFCPRMQTADSDT